MKATASYLKFSRRSSRFHGHTFINAQQGLDTSFNLSASCFPCPQTDFDLGKFSIDIQQILRKAVIFGQYPVKLVPFSVFIRFEYQPERLGL